METGRTSHEEFPIKPKCENWGYLMVGRGETGRVDDLVRKHTDHWGLRPDTTTAYLCGHPTMCENGQGILQRAGWQKGSMFEELYFIPGKEVAAE
ncbi:MAG: hypothetical protein DMG34_08680 [Acidobacteria bacterium]|nr:MAG: hypothetical protein DMG34_08680 [Acidobacteriota bacterium]